MRIIFSRLFKKKLAENTFTYGEREEENNLHANISEPSIPSDMAQLFV